MTGQTTIHSGKWNMVDGRYEVRYMVEAAFAGRDFCEGDGEGLAAVVRAV